MDAIRHTNRAYVFDNSGNTQDKKHTWLAEITEGRELADGEAHALRLVGLF
jgi:hypothetical protein